MRRVELSGMGFAALDEGFTVCRVWVEGLVRRVQE